MVTLFSFVIILIIPQELHVEPLERKVNEVNSITVKRNTLVRRSLTIINDFAPVLRECPQHSFKTTFPPHIILKHILLFHL